MGVRGEGHLTWQNFPEQPFPDSQFDVGLVEAGLKGDGAEGTVYGPGLLQLCPVGNRSPRGGGGGEAFQTLTAPPCLTLQPTRQTLLPTPHPPPPFKESVP